MTWLRVIASRLHAVFTRQRRDHEFDDELRDHLESLTEEYQAAGMSYAEARRAALVESGLDPAEWEHVELAEGAGCFECGGTGYRGRTAIHELLDLTEKIREKILDKRPTSEIKRMARDSGMTFLRESAVEKVRKGVSTLKEINKVTFIEG